MRLGNAGARLQEGYLQDHNHELVVLLEAEDGREHHGACVSGPERLSKFRLRLRLFLAPRRHAPQSGALAAEDPCRPGARRAGTSGQEACCGAGGSIRAEGRRS